MAFRRPLRIVSDDFVEMTDAEIDDLRTMVYAKYIQDPSVRLTVVPSGGNLGGIADTRLIAGGFLTSATATPTDAALDDPITIEIDFQRVNQILRSTSDIEDTDNIRFPLYFTEDGDIRSMSLQDVYDTFIIPAITLLTAGDDVYSIGTSTEKTGYILVSETPIFSDSGANAEAFITRYNELKAAGATSIPLVDTSGELVLDIPLDDFLEEFYLFRRDPNSVGYTYTNPVFFNDSQQIEEYKNSDIESLFQAIVRRSAAAVDGQKIRYSWNGENGNNSGTITDQKLNGTGEPYPHFENANDYRAQEFPNGDFVIANTYELIVGVE